MLRGSTPTLYFKLNNIKDIEDIADIWVTIEPYGHNGGSLTKTFPALKIDKEKKIVSCPLTQEETLNIHASRLAIQMKVLFADNTVKVSKIFKELSGCLLNWDKMVLEKDKDYPATDDDLDNIWNNNCDAEIPAEDDQYASVDTIDEITETPGGMTQVLHHVKEYELADEDDLDSLWEI